MEEERSLFPARETLSSEKVLLFARFFKALLRVPATLRFGGAGLVSRTLKIQNRREVVFIAAEEAVHIDKTSIFL